MSKHKRWLDKLGGVPMPDLSEEAEVKQLCDRIGYGRVMHEASEIWRGIDPVAALSVGPCFGMLDLTKNQWVNANDAKPPDMWTVIIYAVSDIQPEGYIETGCYNHDTGKWHQCIRVDPKQDVKGSMVYEMFKDSVDDTHPNVLYWMDPRPPEGHTGNCND